MSIFKIPLDNSSQQFAIALGGVNYLITCKWNDSLDAGWVLDISDALTNAPIAFNLPLVTGVNILSGLDYLGFQGQLLVYTDGDDEAVPTFENLGIESNLYFVTVDV